MASAFPKRIAENSTCSICLDLFKTPVTLPCGHNFCKVCISTLWDKQAEYNCPLCLKDFKIKPDLIANFQWAEIVEDVKKSLKSEDQPAGVGPEEVPCDMCTGSRQKAVKTCLVCSISYCHAHLELHYTQPRLKSHQLVAPMDRLDDWMCEDHNRLLEFFCTNDRVCLCPNCMRDHASHSVLALKEAREEKKAEVEKVLPDYQQMIEELQEKIQEVNDTAARQVAESKAFSAAVTKRVKVFERVFIQTTSEREKRILRRAEDLTRGLEQKMENLSKEASKAKQLSTSENFPQFLKTSVEKPPSSRDWTAVELLPESCQALRTSLDELRTSLDLMMSELERPAPATVRPSVPLRSDLLQCKYINVF